MSKQDPEFVIYRDLLFQGEKFDLLKKEHLAIGISISLEDIGYHIPVYTPQLAMILTTDNIKARNRSIREKGKEECTFNGVQFKESYIKGFFEGRKFFDKKHNEDTLNGILVEQYIRELHRKYYHEGKSKISGWNYVKEFYPIRIAHQEIKEFGYYSGLVYSVDSLKSDKIEIFEKFYFEKCEQNGRPILNETPKPNLELIAFFDQISNYNHIMELLVNQGYCQAGSYIWKDAKKGYKGFLIAIIKYLHSQGYYKDKKPSHKQIMSIALNTFRVSVGTDRIKQAKPEDFDLDFIPLASTVK